MYLLCNNFKNLLSPFQQRIAELEQNVVSVLEHIGRVSEFCIILAHLCQDSGEQSRVLGPSCFSFLENNLHSYSRI